MDQPANTHDRRSSDRRDPDQDLDRRVDERRADTDRRLKLIMLKQVYDGRGSRTIVTFINLDMARKVGALISFQDRIELVVDGKHRDGLPVYELHDDSGCIEVLTDSNIADVLLRPSPLHL